MFFIHLFFILYLFFTVELNNEEEFIEEAIVDAFDDGQNSDESIHCNF